MEFIDLADSGFFIYPNQQTRTSKNEVLEAVGIIHDIIVDRDKADLLRGINTQLEKAIEYLKSID